MAVRVEPITVFKDNYVWCLINEATQRCIVVDPGEAKPVLAFIKCLKLTLEAVFITHHHWDHTNGLKGLLQHQGVPVYGPAKEKIIAVTELVEDNDKIKLPGWPGTFEVIAIPGHTLGHIAYYAAPMLFCGDTLFSSGCGRLFEGTPDQMLASLDRLARLPDETEIYCGHEYTLNNLNFAQTVEPGNAFIKERLEQVRLLRQKNLPSLPTQLAIERQVNPFLRCDNSGIRDKIEKHWGRKLDSRLDIFTYLRQWKNNYH